MRPGAELPLDAGSSEEASLKNEALERGKKRSSPELRIAPSSVLRVDPDRVMDVTVDSLPIVQESVFEMICFGTIFKTLKNV